MPARVAMTERQRAALLPLPVTEDEVGLLPPTRITDVLSQVNRWTGFVGQFGHVSSGLPPDNEHAFLAALIAEANLLVALQSRGSQPDPTRGARWQ